MSGWQNLLTPLPLTPPPVKRRVFVSYSHRNQQREAENFVFKWWNVFTPRALGMAFDNNLINSDNPAYVMSRIRAEYLGTRL